MAQFALTSQSNAYKRYVKADHPDDMVVDLTFPVPLSCKDFIIFFKFGNIDDVNGFELYFKTSIFLEDYKKTGLRKVFAQRTMEKRIADNLYEYAYECEIPDDLQDLYRLQIVLQNNNSVYGFGDFDIMWKNYPFPENNPYALKLYAWEPTNKSAYNKYPIFYFRDLVPQKENFGTTESVIKGNLLKSTYENNIRNTTYVATQTGVLPTVTSTSGNYTTEEDVKNLTINIDKHEVINSSTEVQNEKETISTVRNTNQDTFELMEIEPTCLMDGVTLSKHGHLWANYTCIQKEDCLTDGLYRATCGFPNCDEEHVITIKGQHNFVNGECTVCGSPDPNYQSPGTNLLAARTGAYTFTTTLHPGVYTLHLTGGGGATTYWYYSSAFWSTGGGSGATFEGTFYNPKKQSCEIYLGGNAAASYMNLGGTRMVTCNGGGNAGFAAVGSGGSVSVSSSLTYSGKAVNGNSGGATTIGTSQKGGTSTSSHLWGGGTVLQGGAVQAGGGMLQYTRFNW